jgi:hypothetical protein
MSITNDPFEAATQAGEGRNTYYGKADVTAGFVTLKKGVGKQPFNEHLDDIRERRTEVKIVVNPIDAMGISILLQRDLIAESSEWSKYTWASLRDKCGLKSVRDLHGKYCKVTLQGTGETYTTKRGDTQERKAFVFEALYQTAQEATAAYYADNGGQPESDPAMAVDMGPGAGANGTAATTNGNAERETAKAFLQALVKQSGGDKGKLSASIAQMPMIAKYFTADSPEVVQMMAGVN